MTTRILLIVFLAIVWAAPGWAGLDEGVAAYERGDYATALTAFLALAEQSDADAQYNLGLMYYEGKGVSQDFQQAVSWYRKAAEQGQPLAQAELGASYFLGHGVKSDEEEAARWYRQAAEKGVPKAQVLLGDMYYAGWGGLAKNYVEAFKWQMLAAKQGIASAQYDVGGMYLDGRGVPQNFVLAGEWFRLVAEHGGRQGLSGPQDFVQAHTWGDLFVRGNACRELGKLYENGKGVPQDYAQAHMWFNLAAANDTNDAARLRDKLAQKMTPAQITEAQKLARDWKPKDK